MTATRDSDAPHVDAAVLTGLVDDLGADRAAEVCGLFLADARALVREVGGACESSDAPSAAAAAHRLKSASGFVGAAALSALSAEIEGLAREGRLDEVRPRVGSLPGELDHVSAELAALVRPPQP